MLYIVATPIGNVRDASERMKTILSSVDFILCEDTRRSKKLLQMLNLPIPHLISCHAHNENARVSRAVEELESGKTGAYISDAGMPAISDPGMRLVQAAHQAGLRVVPIPGPSAVSTALAASGFETPPYHFLGFPPRKSKALQQWILNASQLQGVLVLFEAGNRFGALVSALQKTMIDREMCLCRELTKIHQEIIRQSIVDFDAENVLGEVTVVIGPGKALKSESETMQGIKNIAQQLGAEWGLSKREAYNLLMTIKPEEP